MEQQTKTEYIAYLKSASWQDIKEEADKYDIEKHDDEKWKDLIPAIADAKFAAPSPDNGFLELSEVEKEFLDADLVTEEEEDAEPEKEDAIAESKDSDDKELYFDYVRQGVVLACQYCNYQLRVDLDGEKICPVSHPKCPRSSPKEVN